MVISSRGVESGDFYRTLKIDGGLTALRYKDISAVGITLVAL